MQATYSCVTHCLHSDLFLQYINATTSTCTSQLKKLLKIFDIKTAIIPRHKSPKTRPKARAAK